MLRSNGLIIALAVTLMGGASMARAQQPEYQGHIWWAWNNWDAGGAVNCAPLYVAAGVPQYIAVGGRAGLLRQAAFMAATGGPAGAAAAMGFVLMSQCHNPAAQQVLIQAGPQNVIPYLLWLGATHP